MRATRDALRTLGSARLPRLDDSRESPAQRLGVRTWAEGRAAHRVVRPNSSVDQDVSCDHGAGSSDDLVGLTEIAFSVEPRTLWECITLLYECTRVFPVVKVDSGPLRRHDRERAMQMTRNYLIYNHLRAGQRCRNGEARVVPRTAPAVPALVALAVRRPEGLGRSGFRHGPDLRAR
jgi:hypothetical protein